jgi:hypothetical protein
MKGSFVLATALLASGRRFESCRGRQLGSIDDWQSASAR